MKGLAYNATWLDNRCIQTRTTVWHKRGLLATEELTAIRQKYHVGFYSPNVFIRLGLAFFMCILINSIIGLLAVGMYEIFDQEESVGILMLLLGGGYGAMLEVFIRKNHYRSGIDDILLYMALGYVITGLCLLVSTTDSMIVYTGLSLPVLAFAAYRYIDSLVTVTAYGCLLLFVASVFIEMGGVALHLLPFAGMGVGAGSYFLIRKLQKKQESRFWADALALLEILSLVTFYACGNYFVVQKGYAELMYTTDNPLVPMPWLFWIITLATPVVYVYRSLTTKDRTMLRAGLILVAVAILTFKYYFSLGHHSVTITLGGAVLFAAAYYVIRLLKKGNLSFTYEDDVIETEDSLQAEALIVTQTFGQAIGTEPTKDFTFGGGEFGGGGAGGEF